LSRRPQGEEPRNGPMRPERPLISPFLVSGGISSPAHGPLRSRFHHQGDKSAGNDNGFHGRHQAPKGMHRMT
jgi:hypothetical protein